MSVSSAPVDKPVWNILRLDGGHDILLTAPHLGEFDAVIYDDRASSVFSGLEILPPGKRAFPEVDQVVRDLDLLVRRRAAEAFDLLEHGGILVIRLRARSGLSRQAKSGFDLYPQTETVSFSDWWIPTVPRLRTLCQVPKEIINEAYGSRIQVERPDHFLEPYLMTARYAAILEPLVFADPSAQPATLATNGSGNVIACESDLGRGTVILVPADGDQDVLEKCVRDLLLVRRATTSAWRVPEEVATLERFQENTEKLRAERDQLIVELAEVWNRKTPVMESPEVRRVLDRFRKATEASTSERETLRLLHSMVEIVEDQLGGEAALIATLGVSKATVNAIKRPANEKRWDVRHSTVGEPETLEPGAVAAAIEAGRQIAQGFINSLYGRAGPLRTT